MFFDRVLFISWQTTGSSQEWLPVNRWRLDGMANAATFNTNNTLNIYENVQPGRTIQVWYTATPNTLDANTDDFADVTGLPESSKDVVILGASYKLTTDGAYAIVAASDGIYDVTTAGAVRKLWNQPTYVAATWVPQVIAYVKERIIVAALEGTVEVGVYEISRAYTTPTPKINASNERW